MVKLFFFPGGLRKKRKKNPTLSQQIGFIASKPIGFGQVLVVTRMDEIM